MLSSIKAFFFVSQGYLCDHVKWNQSITVLKSYCLVSLFYSRELNTEAQTTCLLSLLRDKSA